MVRHRRLPRTILSVTQTDCIHTYSCIIPKWKIWAALCRIYDLGHKANYFCSMESSLLALLTQRMKYILSLPPRLPSSTGTHTLSRALTRRLSLLTLKSITVACLSLNLVCSDLGKKLPLQRLVFLNLRFYFSFVSLADTFAPYSLKVSIFTLSSLLSKVKVSRWEILALKHLLPSAGPPAAHSPLLHAAGAHEAVA